MKAKESKPKRPVGKKQAVLDRLLSMSPEEFQRMVEALEAKDLINPEQIEQTSAHTETLTTGFPAAFQPFARDLNGLEPLDEHEPPPPEWVTVVMLKINFALIEEAARGERVSQGRYWGRLLGLSLALNNTRMPFEDASPEVKTSWEALTTQMTDSTAKVQAAANGFPPEMRLEYFKGYTEGLERGAGFGEFGLLGPNGPLMLATVFGWREIVGLGSVGAFHAWLVNHLDRNSVGEDVKRIERFCKEIGLKFRGRGRPRKINTQL